MEYAEAGPVAQVRLLACLLPCLLVCLLASAVQSLSTPPTLHCGGCPCLCDMLHSAQSFTISCSVES